MPGMVSGMVSDVVVTSPMGDVVPLSWMAEKTAHRRGGHDGLADSHTGLVAASASADG